MNTRKRILWLLIVFSMMFLFSNDAQAERDVAGKIFYTIANIWYEHPEKIYSTNYHKGVILPAGSKVTIVKVDSDEIRFSDDSGIDFKIVYVKKHSPGVSTWNYFDWYFSENNPMDADGAFNKFTKSEKENIREGIVQEGMSRESVLMSYGYPPSIKTPSLKSNIWIYMENRFSTKSITFKDNHVINVKD